MHRCAVQVPSPITYSFVFLCWLLIIQCAYLIFEGLLPQTHNKIDLELIFALAVWHGLVKLRMHSEHTLCLLQDATESLGAWFQKFQSETCAHSHFNTWLVVLETTACNCKKPHLSNNNRKVSSEAVLPSHKTQFNMFTYKFHALEHYVSTIRRFGTTASYSMQAESLSLCFQLVLQFGLC